MSVAVELNECHPTLSLFVLVDSMVDIHLFCYWIFTDLKLRGAGKLGSKTKGSGFFTWTLVATYIVMTRNTRGLLGVSRR